MRKQADKRSERAALWGGIGVAVGMGLGTVFLGVLGSVGFVIFGILGAVIGIIASYVYRGGGNGSG